MSSSDASGAAEPAKGERVIAIRDSKDPDGPKLFFSVSVWKDFLDRVKAGEFELEEGMVGLPREAQDRPSGS